MKKLLYGIAALALAFLAGSCQRENLEPVAEGTTVTYTVQVPGALTTKAGETYAGAVNQLVYEVHRVLADETTQLLYQKTETITNGVVNLDIEFVKDQNFKVLFWAQKDGVYNTDGAIDLKAVQVPTRQAGVTENDYEAFYGTDDFTNGTSAASGKVTLTRAVSLLSIGTTPASLKVGGENENVVLDGATVTVKALPNTLNVMTGVASANADQTYYSATGTTFVVGTETYVYVAKNYVAFADAEKSTVDVELTITTDEGTINHSIPSVPLKRNFKTNIVGDLITAKADYTVTLNDEWGTPDEVVDYFAVSTAQDLQEAIDNIQTGAEGSIVLEGNIDLNDLAALLGTLSTKAGSDPVSITVPAGKIITLDLNGYTLSGVDETQTSFGLITNKGNLTIVNSAKDKAGKIMLKAKVESGWSRYSSVISTQPGSTLTVGAGVEIEHLGGTSMSYGIDVLTNGKGTSVVAVIDGATVKSTYRAIRQFLNGIEANNSLTVKSGSVIESTKGNKSIWMQDPSENPNSGKLVVEAGAQLKTDAYLDVDERSTEWPIEVSIAASALVNGSKIVSELPVGYSIAETDGVWTVSRDWSVNPEQTEYTIYTATGLKWVAYEVNRVEQYAKNIFDGKTVLLANDIDLNGAEWIPIGDFGNTSNQFTGTFDGQNHTISNFVVDFNENKVDSKNRSSFGFFGNVNGTVKNLTVSGVTNDIKTPKFVGALIGRLNGGLVENCHVKNSTIEINNWTVGGLVGQINNGKISGCSVEGTTIKGHGAVAGIVGIALDSGERTIENCSVKNTTIVQNGSFGGDYDKMFGAIVGALYSGTLTVNLNACSVESTTIKDVTSTELCGFISEGGKLVVDGYEVLAPGLGYNNTFKTYAVSSAEGLVAMSEISIKAGESVVLTADIDLAGVEFNGLNAFNPEKNNIFDGQGYTVSNWTYTGKADDMGFIKNWVGPIKNLTIKKAVLRTGGRSAVIAAKPYGNIENCHVEDCNLQASYWACGLITGMHNSGNMTNCTAKNSYIKSTGGTGAITGVLNETSGERTYTGCVAEGCTINNGGTDPYAGAAILGLINIDNASVKFISCVKSGNTYEGTAKDEIYGYNAGDNITITIE